MYDNSNISDSYEKLISFMNQTKLQLFWLDVTIYNQFKCTPHLYTTVNLTEKYSTTSNFDNLNRHHIQITYQENDPV